jgi:hypothetical protein
VVDLQALELPRHVHKPSVPGAWVYLIVHTQDELVAALADGWSLNLVIIDAEPSGSPPPAEASTVPDPPDAAPPHRGWPKGKPRKPRAE